MTVGPSEAQTFWTAFPHSLMRRGLRGVQLVISDAQLAALPVALHAQRAGPQPPDPTPRGQRCGCGCGCEWAA